MGQVIRGWDEGVAKMSLGEKSMLRITSDYGYGPRGAGGVIPPNADLNFEVELLGINGKSTSFDKTWSCLLSCLYYTLLIDARFAKR